MTTLFTARPQPTPVRSARTASDRPRGTATRRHLLILGAITKLR
jgi:hypothetical protein